MTHSPGSELHTASSEPASHTVDAAAQAVANGAERLTRGAAAAWTEGAVQLRQRAHQVSDDATGYIRREPLKSVLIAAAIGAALMALLSLSRRGA